jgi:hypothetical protein
MKKLIEIKNKLLTDNTISENMRHLLESIGKDKRRPLGKFNISSWAIEVTRGCNLKCGCCATRLFPKGQYNFMSIDLWEKFMDLVVLLTPYNRLDFAASGEPTLNKDLDKILKISRNKSPYSWLEIITNGTTLIKGDWRYKDFFENGANIVYVDMYSPEEKHIELAKKSGYNWYLRRNVPEGAPRAWSYYNKPDLKWIILQENPANWTKRTVSSGRFSTFFNNLDWEASKKYNLYPIKEAPNRRCNMPFKIGNISYDGYYSFCCYDFMRYTHEHLWNIDDGIEGFFKYWLGAYMQNTRKLLHNKDRKSHELCSKCAFTSSRGDIPCWKDNATDFYWDGSTWKRNNTIPKNHDMPLFN